VINVTKPYLPNQKRYNDYVNRIFETGWITNNGPLLREFENRLKDYLGVKNLILVTNGTLALQVAYKALDLKDEVITTPFSFVATASSLVWNNLQPIFCDIESETLTIDPKKISPLINEKTSAIVPTHVFGNACKIEEIEEISKRFNLKTIYDASHCFDVLYKDTSILSYGDISTISFHATKLFHTIEGGALITDDDALAQKIKLLINFGITGPEQIKEVGINAKMNEFQAAMGLALLDEIEEIKKKRELIWEFYTQNIPNGIQVQEWNKNATLNLAYFPIILENEECLLKLQKAFNLKQINPRRYFNPSLDTLTFLNPINTCPISQDISSRILCIPIYPDLSFDDVKQIVNIIKENL